MLLLPRRVSPPAGGRCRLCSEVAYSLDVHYELAEANCTRSADRWRHWFSNGTASVLFSLEAAWALRKCCCEVAQFTSPSRLLKVKTGGGSSFLWLQAGCSVGADQDTSNSNTV